MSARTDAGEMEGFLAYRDANVIAWLNAQPLHKLSHLTSRLAIPAMERDVPAHEAAAIVCWVLDPSCQQHNARRTLLAAALDSFKQRGIRMVDAFPRKADQRSASRHSDHGWLSFFVDAGFAVMREEAEFLVVRKQLG